jgi:peptide/nickel transport system substrate-binding protein
MLRPGRVLAKHSGGFMARFRGFAVALAALGLALATTTASAQTPKRGGTLNTIVQPEPPLIVPGLNNQGPTWIVSPKIYQGLLRYSADLKPMPNLAKSWTISPDGKTYTFKLQENVKWHDGAPFSADDVVFSIMKWHMELSPRSRQIFLNIKNMTAPDPLTVVIELEKPFEPLILMFDETSAAMIPKHIYDGTDFKTNPANQHPIGTGPFKFDQWVRGSYIHLVRNDAYWKPGQPYLDDIYYRVIPDSASRALALETGQVQLTQANDLEPFDVPRFAAMPNLTLETKGWEMYSPVSWIDLNLRDKPLDDKRFRQALMYALDRNFIRDKIFFGLGKVAAGPIADATRFHDPSITPYPYDPKKALALLDEMGLKPDGQGVRANLKMLTLPYGEVWTRLAEYCKQAFAQIGVAVTLESTDAGGWSSRIGNWDYQTSFNFLYQYGDPSLGVARTYVSSNIKKITFTNTEGYQNPEVDAAFDKAAYEPQAAERQKLFSQAQKLLVEDVPVVWLMQLEFPTIYDKRLHDVIISGTGPNDDFGAVYFSE